MARSLPLLLLLSPAVLLFLLPSPSTSQSLPLRINLTHIDSNTPNLSKEDRNLLAVKRSKLRMEFISSTLSASSQDVRTTVHYSNKEYTADFAIGSPPVSVTAVLDTGSDLIWTKCEQSSSYDPSASSTYSSLSCGSNLCQDVITSCSDGSTCSFSAPYGSAKVDGTMATETFSFSGTDVPNLAFGCSNSEMGSATEFSGILGMGGGQLSLISQLGSGKFSYCLTTQGSQSLTSPLLLGSLATPDPSSQSTPLLQNPNIQTYYYLSLQGITVGSTLLSIPSSAFTGSSNGRGGVIIDSGTSFTSLVPAAYNVLKQEFQSQMGLAVAEGNYDLCFSYPTDESFQPPKLIFHFDGADMDFPAENYLIEDGGGSLLCLAILPSNQDFSLFGNFQQQNMLIVYDTQGGKLSFAPVQCENV